MEFSRVFRKMEAALQVRPLPRYVVSVGGARSGKTYSILQLLHALVINDGPGDITSVVSESLPHLKRGAIRDYENILGVPLRDLPEWNETEHTMSYPRGGKLEFFSADTPGKVQGPQRKRLFVNEAIHLKYDTYRQMAVRTAGTVFLDYNPEQVSWIDDKILTRDNCVKIHSTYLDNEFLSAEQVAEIESNRTDSGWWRVFGEGLTGVLEGLIFPDFELVDALPEVSDGMNESYGLDYGFTNDTSCLMHILTDNRRKEIWADEIFYRIGMLNSDMAAGMKEAGLSRSVPVYADSAEPKTNTELHRYGFNVLGAYKAVRKAEQLQMMKGYRLKITKRSLNCIREVRGYVWQKDRDGRLLNEPIGIMDHSMDALRYGCFPYLRTPTGNRTVISRT